VSLHQDLSGKTFGKLKVLAFSHAKGGVRYYACKCSCGNPCVANSKSLKTGSTKSCGCLRKDHAKSLNEARRDPQPWAQEMKVYVYHLGVDRKSRRHLAVSWALTLEGYVRLSQSKCFYCGCDPAGKPSTKSLKAAGILKNGIDRVDNRKGYTPGNCVSCCGPCNREKGGRSVREFLESTWRRYQHLVAKGLLEAPEVVEKVGVHIPPGDPATWLT
jgi:hypothetical protein